MAEHRGARGTGRVRRLDDRVTGRGRPLVVTRDEELLDELLRLSSAGGVEVTVAMDAVAAEADWSIAPLVVVGADRVAEVARRGLPRRLGVILVAGAERAHDLALWPEAEALHAEHVVVLPDARPWLVTRFAEHGRSDGLTRTAIARTVAVVAGGEATEADELALALAVTARRQGLSTLLIGGTAPGSCGREPGVPVAGPAWMAGAGALPRNGGAGGSLAILALERRREVGIAPDAMAAALRAGRCGRDLVLVDLPGGLDEAALLALTCADRGYLVVVAEIRGCAAATRVAAVVRRHCPELALVVRAAGPRGLRPAEVAEALDLPLVGVLPPAPPLARSVAVSPPDPSVEEGPLSRLSRRLLVDLDVRPAARTGSAADPAGRGQP